MSSIAAAPRGTGTRRSDTGRGCASFNAMKAQNLHWPIRPARRAVGKAGAPQDLQLDIAVRRDNRRPAVCDNGGLGRTEAGGEDADDG